MKSSNSNKHTLWTKFPEHSSVGEYAVFIDETHTNPPGEDPDTQPPKETRFVAVVAPLSGFPEQKGRHAVNESENTLRNDLEKLSASSVSVLGLTFDFCADNSSWLHRVVCMARAVAHILDKSVRLKKLSFYVEEHSQVEPIRNGDCPGNNARKEGGDSDSMVNRQRSLNEQAEIHFGTLALLLMQDISPDSKITIEIVPKIEDYKSTTDNLSLTEKDLANAYWADLISYIWRRNGFPSQQRSAKLLNHPWIQKVAPYCLFDKRQTQAIMRTLESVQDVISESDWLDFSFQASPDKKSPNYYRFLLNFIGERSKKNLKEWERYLEYTLRHLHSKAILMNALKVQVDWLKEYLPKEDFVLPKQIELSWLMAQIAEENHRGSYVCAENKRRFNELCEILMEENIHLVVGAKLHLAVSETNTFNFGGAEKILSPLEKQPALGVQLRGRLLSSLGQHKAFLGKNKEAIKYFEKAINECFKKLSYPPDARADISQTTSYKVIAMMDLCSESSTEMSRRELEKEVKAYLEDACRDFSCSNQEEPLGWDVICSRIATQQDSKKRDWQKYHHHVLLRYIASGEAPEEVKDSYRKCCEKWTFGDSSHPWELIEFYREVCFGKKVSDKKCHEICNKEDDSVTLKIISLVLLGALYPERLKYRCEFGIMGEERANIVHEQPEKRLEALAFIKKVLPFNFR